MADFMSEFTEKGSIIGPKAQLWATVDLNVRSKPDAAASKVGSVKQGTSVPDMQKLIENAMWYYSESLKGYVASGDGKKEYWTAKAPAKISIKPAAKAPAKTPTAPAAVPGVSAEAMQPQEGDNKTVLIVAAIAVAAMLAFMLSGDSK